MKQYRLMNRDGTFNISRRGLRKGVWQDVYHALLAMSRKRFFLLIGVFYFAVNALFALGYTLCGEGALEGIAPGSWEVRWVDAFFFSVQTLATIGYGRITPVGIPANILVTFEALFGLLGLALMTGLLFARFSKPTARVRFSRIALLSKQDGVPCLIFRMANARLNQIVEARVKVVMARNELTSEGERFRNFYNLDLERSESPIFSLSWTVVHPITETSPLKGWTMEMLKEGEVEILVALTGIDDTFSQTIHARVSYIPDEIIEDGFFEDMISRDENQMLQIDLSRIHHYRKA